MSQVTQARPVSLDVKRPEVVIDLHITGLQVPISRLTWGQPDRAGWSKWRSTQWGRFSAFRTRFPSKDQTWTFFSRPPWDQFYSLTWGRF